MGTFALLVPALQGQGEGHCNPSPHMIRGGDRNFPTGADSSDEGAKIWFLGYYKCQKSPKKITFHLPTEG